MAETHSEPLIGKKRAASRSPERELTPEEQGSTSSTLGTEETNEPELSADVGIRLEGTVDGAVEVEEEVRVRGNKRARLEERPDEAETEKRDEQEPSVNANNNKRARVEEPTEGDEAEDRAEQELTVRANKRARLEERSDDEETEKRDEQGPPVNANKRARVEEPEIEERGERRLPVHVSKKARPEEATNDAGTSNAAEPAVVADSELPPPKEAQLETKDTASSVTEEPTTVTAEESPVLAKSSAFLSIPPEIFAEIMLYTSSPRDVVAVARSCKSLSQTLMQPSSNFIWQNIRENAVPIPPPELKEYGMEALFTEATYAHFVYGGGKCEICGEETDRHYVSYALRIRLCRQFKCEEAFAKTGLISVNDFRIARPDIVEIVPVLEDKSLFKANVHVPYPSTRKDIYEKLDSFLKEVRDKPGLLVARREREPKKEAWMRFCMDLAHWRRKVQHKFYEKKKENDNLSQDFAAKMGWDFKDMINSTQYGPYHRHQCHIFESVKESDLVSMKAGIGAELLRLAEKRDRRRQEKVYGELRLQVIQHHRYLGSTKAFPILPALSAFRQLPVIAMLQTMIPENTTPKLFFKGLKASAVLEETLKYQICQWVAQAKEDLGQLLGYTKWKSANKHEIHPVERISARFKCNRCTSFPDKYSEDECFDFVGACMHECSKPGRHGNFKWDVTHFEKDEKAVSAIQAYESLSCFGGLAKNVSAVESKPFTIDRLLCKSCDPPVFMAFDNLIGHSHRHDTMALEPCTRHRAGDMLGAYTFIPGYTKKILQPNAKAKAVQGSKTFGCRQCYSKALIKAASQRNPAEHKGTESAAETPSTPNTDPGTTQPAPHPTSEATAEGNGPKVDWLTFHGLRSHLKAKHDIAQIRDEDYFFSKVPVL